MDDVKYSLEPKCSWCAGLHEGVVCPTIKAIEYHPDGTMKRVEFKTPADYVIPVFTPHYPYYPYNPLQPQWPYAPYYPITAT